MFAFSILPGAAQAICWLLMGLIAALLIGGFVLNPYDAARGGRMTKRTELPQIVFLIIIALIVWIFSASGAGLFPALSTFILGGLIFGFVGDLNMADVFKQKNHILFGMTAFAVGHVLYMLAFREIALSFTFHKLELYAVALLSMWILGVVLWFVLVRTPAKITFMQYAALGYTLFLASMAAFALGLALHDSRFIPLAVGAVLFLVSDALIAAHLFGKRNFPYRADLVWVTYIAAQVCIVMVAPMVYAMYFV